MEWWIPAFPEMAELPEWLPCFALFTGGFCFTCCVKQRDQVAMRGWVSAGVKSLQYNKELTQQRDGGKHALDCLKHFLGIWEGLKPGENLKAGLAPPGKHVLCCFPCKVWGSRHALSLPAGLHTTSKVFQWQAGKGSSATPTSWQCLDQGEVPVEMEILQRLSASTGLGEVDNELKWFL